MEPDPNIAGNSADGSRIVAQPVAAPLTRAAIFLAATLNPGPEPRSAIRSFCPDLSTLFRAVDFRDLQGGLSCVMGFGSDAWDRLFGSPRPANLHPFREIRSGSRHAVFTAGDLLFHIRAKRMDLCFELATQIMARIGNAVSPVDEVHGFRYFDDRDLFGFVDGTENPRGDDAYDAVLIGEEDPAFTGGSYVIVQKYMHDLSGWNALPVEAQERIIGRKKLDDIELDDSVKPTSAHNALTTIVEDGKEIKILRDNMPFGRPGSAEFGTYFIGYSRSPRTVEQMLENMFIGKPPGNYDRLLDFSRALTGNLFFVPSATFLDNVPDDSSAPVVAPTASTNGSTPSAPTENNGSLRIVLEHVKRLVKDEIIWAPAIAGAFVVTTRGGDFDLRIGQDLSIGYLSHTESSVRLYLQETFTFLYLTSESAVALAAPAKAKPNRRESN
jgi:porphyrinogen peroxidase